MEVFLNILAGIMIMSYNFAQVSGESSTGPKYRGYWKFDGSDPDLSYGGSVNFTDGRCPGSKVMVFDNFHTVMVPNVNIGDCDYTVAFWMRLSQQYQDVVMVLGRSRSGKFLVLLLEMSALIICREVSTRINLTCVRHSSGAFTNSWTHIAVTCKQDNEVKIFINGETITKLYNYSLPFSDVFSAVIMPHKESFIIYYYSSQLIMDLHIFGFALPRDEIYDLYRDLMLITNQTKEVKGRTVTIRWEQESCSVDIYTVHYRELKPANYGSIWKAVNVSRFADHYNLELECFKEYEVAVTGWGARTLKPWKVITGRDFPQIVNLKVKENNVNITWVPTFKGECQVFGYLIYYRKVISEVNTRKWNVVNLSQYNATNHNLQLQCDTEYEVTVTTQRANGETPVNQSKLWKVKTGRGKPSPPVGDNNTMEINGCPLNYTWSPPLHAVCPLTKYIIYYREIQSDGKEADWMQIHITQLKETSYVIPLICDRKYEIAMSAKDEEKESVMSNFWRVKTKSSATDIPSKMFLSGGQAVGVIVGGLALLAMILVGISCHRKRTRKRKLNAVLAKRSKSDMILLLPREVPPERITFMEELGRGAFGKVQRGVLKELPTVEIFNKPRDQRLEIKEAKVVAIKTLLATATEGGKELFLQEIEFMKQIGSHRNVLNMLGYWVKSEPIMLILEYVPHGDLLQWLRGKRQQMKFKNSIDGEIFKDLTQAASEGEIESTKTTAGSTENNMPKSFITVKEEASLRKTLVFKASGKEEDDENREEKLEQSCHDVKDVVVSRKGKHGTPREEPALVGSYDERTDGNLGHSREDETKTERNGEDERQEGEEEKEENECEYADYSEPQCSPLQTAGPSGIDKDPHHSCDVSGPESEMNPIKKEQKEMSRSTTQYDHPEDVEQADNFYSNDLLCFAWQIANGMNYLASKGLVHRDLAARNILLGEDRVVKIADFGLLRDTQGNIYEMKHTKKLPIKWTAPEALHNGIYTTKSDVWSFGVCLWELTTMGGIPYPGISHKELYRLLKTGYRMAKPKSCSDDLYGMMSDCWKEVPDERPTFEQLIVQLEEMMTKDTPYFDFEKLDETEAYYNEAFSNSNETSRSLDTKL